MNDIDGYIGDTVKLHIDVNGKSLFYSAKIVSVSDDAFKFIDKFGNVYVYDKKCILAIMPYESGG